ncbi:MAG: CotH kinase family protein [Pseudobacteriovorax sp.]|nr:CotH kinase family protein [Pseudobacteriovorax sp.]
MKLALFVAEILFLSMACNSKNPDFESYGLRTIHLVIPSENLAIMESTLTQKNSVRASLEAEGRSFAIKVGYSGKSSLFHPKRSYNFKITDGHSLVDSKNWRLSSQANEATAVKSIVGFEVFRKLGLLAPKVEAVSLYINYEFKGLYYLIEEVDLELYKSKGVYPEQIYKARYGRLSHADFSADSINDLSLGFKIIHGSERWDSLEKLILAINQNDQASSARAIDALLDKDNYLRYLAAAVYLNHWDGYSNNFFIYQSNHDLRMRWTLWDLDHVWEENPYQTGDIFGKNALSSFLLAQVDDRRSFLSIMNALIDSFDTTAILNTIDETVALTQAAYEADPYLNIFDRAAAVDDLKTNINHWHSELLKDLETHSQKD